MYYRQVTDYGVSYGLAHEATAGGVGIAATVTARQQIHTEARRRVSMEP